MTQCGSDRSSEVTIREALGGLDLLWDEPFPAGQARILRKVAHPT